MPASIPLPNDEELPDEVRETLATLPPLNIFRMLGRLPASFRPFLELGGSLLGSEEIDARTREIAILRVAHVTGAGYEWAQHAQLGKSVGLEDAEIDAARAGDPTGLDDDCTLAWQAADEISRDVRLSDATLERAIERFGEAGAEALILCVAYYNMVSRFLESTRVEIEESEYLSGDTPASIIERGEAGGA